MVTTPLWGVDGGVAELKLETGPLTIGQPAMGGAPVPHTR